MKTSETCLARYTEICKRCLGIIPVGVRVYFDTQNAQWTHHECSDGARNVEHPCDSVPVAVDCKCYLAGAADYQEAHGGFYRRGLEDARMAVINKMLEDGWDEMTTAVVASAINPLCGES